jgi:hypothetical protein
MTDTKALRSSRYKYGQSSAVGSSKALGLLGLETTDQSPKSGVKTSRRASKKGPVGSPGVSRFNLRFETKRRQKDREKSPGFRILNELWPLSENRQRGGKRPGES